MALVADYVSGTRYRNQMPDGRYYDFLSELEYRIAYKEARFSMATMGGYYRFLDDYKFNVSNPQRCGQIRELNAFELGRLRFLAKVQKIKYYSGECTAACRLKQHEDKRRSSERAG